MKHCEILNEDLFAYIGKELPPVLIQQMDKHISECTECARIVAEFKAVMALMEEQKFVEPLPFAETRIIQGIENSLAQRQKSASPVFARFLQPVLLSAGVLTAVAIGFFIGSNVAHTHSQFSENDEMIEAVRSDLNVPEYMTDDLFHFTE